MDHTGLIQSVWLIVWCLKCLIQTCIDGHPKEKQTSNFTVRQPENKKHHKHRQPTSGRGENTENNAPRLGSPPVETKKKLRTTVYQSLKVKPWCFSLLSISHFMAYIPRESTFWSQPGLDCQLVYKRMTAFSFVCVCLPTTHIKTIKQPREGKQRKYTTSPRRWAKENIWTDVHPATIPVKQGQQTTHQTGPPFESKGCVARTWYH